MPTPIPDPVHQKAILISFLQLRRAIGWCGIALPIFLFLAFTFQYPHCSLPPSISHFYYTGLGTYFTGTLFAVAIFLFHYRMSEKIDRLAAQVAAVGQFKGDALRYADLRRFAGDGIEEIFRRDGFHADPTG